MSVHHEKYNPVYNTITIRTMVGVLVIGILLGLVKTAAYLLTDSNAIFTDALESRVNIAAGSIALYSVWLSSQPSDAEHPYGHGKVEFLSSGMEAIMMIAAGGLIVVKAVSGFLQPEKIQHLDLGILLTTLAGSINFIMGLLLVRIGKKNHSPTLKASGLHLMSDGYSSLGLILGLGVIYFTNIYWLDPLIAIGFGLYILYSGWKTFRQSVSGVMDESDKELVDEIIAILNQHRRAPWVDIHNLRVIRYGPRLHVDCHITVPWYFSVQEAHTELKDIEDILNRYFDNRVEIFIHTDPCLPESCPLCSLSDCPVRKRAFEKRVEWSFANITQNNKHLISRYRQRESGSEE